MAPIQIQIHSNTSTQQMSDFYLVICLIVTTWRSAVCRRASVESNVRSDRQRSAVASALFALSPRGRTKTPTPFFYWSSVTFEKGRFICHVELCSLHFTSPAVRLTEEIRLTCDLIKLFGVINTRVGVGVSFLPGDVGVHWKPSPWNPGWHWQVYDPCVLKQEASRWHRSCRHSSTSEWEEKQNKDEDKPNVSTAIFKM